jgi:hypothetical protein
MWIIQKNTISARSNASLIRALTGVNLCATLRHCTATLRQFALTLTRDELQN